MKLKKLFKVVMYTLAVMLGAFFTTTSAAVSEPLTVYFNDIGGLWPGGNTASCEKDVTVDGRKCVMLKPTHDTATGERVIASTGANSSFKPLNIDLKNYKYIEISYKYTSSNPGTLTNPKINIGITNSGGYTKKTIFQDSLNTLGSNVWCKAVFDISDVVAAENLTGDGTFCQVTIYPFGTNNINEVSRDSVIYFDSITFLSEKPDVPTYESASAPVVDETPEEPSKVPGESLIVFFNDIGGLWPGSNTATYEKGANVDGRSCVILKPSHDNATSDRVIVTTGQDASFKPLNIELKKYKYIEISYKYTSSNPGALANPKMNIGISAYGGYLKKVMYRDSINTLGTDGWCKAVFDISDIVAPENLTGEGVFCQLYIYPFGNNKIGNVSRDSVICFESVTFHEAKPAVPAYTINTTPVAAPVKDVIEIPFSKVASGIVDRKYTADIVANLTYDGFNVTSIYPTPETAEAKAVIIDSATNILAEMKIDLSHYKYAGITYYYENDESSLDASMSLSFLTNGGYLKEGKTVSAQSKLETGKWAEAIFDISEVVAEENLTGNVTGVFKQFHFRPFGSTDVAQIPADSVLHIAELAFYAKDPVLLSEEERNPGLTSKVNNITVPFTKVAAGIVDKKNTAIIEKAECDGRDVIKIIPTPETAQTEKIIVDSATNVLAVMDIPLASYEYSGVTYKYVSASDKETDMRIGLLRNGGMLKESTYFTSLNYLKKNEWNEVYFNIANVKNLLTGDANGVFKQFHLYPIGNYKMNEIPAGDIVYVENITFYATIPDALKQNKTEAELLGNIDLSAYPDQASVAIADYHNGIPNNKQTADLKELTKDGIYCLEVTPTPEKAQVDTVNIDGWEYLSANFNLDVYKYAAVLYKYESSTPLENTRMNVTLSKNTGTALNASITKPSNEYIVEGEWAIATFNFEHLIPSALNPDVADHTVKQIYIYPYGSTSVKNLNADNKMYLAQVMFFKEKPNVKVIKSYINGYDDSTFRPANPMTRAEACTIVARLTAGTDSDVPVFASSMYTDIDAAAWYSKYVAYCESKGFLRSFKGPEFFPNQNITRAEFVDLVFSMGLSNDSGLGVVFNDVSDTHERYGVIKAAASSGLINGYMNEDGSRSFKPDNPITRAEVVTVINSALGRKTAVEDISADVPFVFTDVNKTHWAYAEIVEASLYHTVSPSGKWLGNLTDLETLLANADYADYAATEAKIAEVDALSAKRKEEILSATTSVNVTGTKYYVSNNGNDENNGLSPDTAWASVEKVNSAELKQGDGVFFERGGLWRGNQLKAKAGVTYSAYGVGEKPKFYGSPENGAVVENWSLYYEDASSGKKIWVYNKEFTDVGAIIFNDGEKFSTKAIPNYYNGKYVLRDNINVEFDIKTHLDKDLMIFSELSSNGATIDPGSKYTVGKLYLRCDAGNPGEIFRSIEFGTRQIVVEIGANPDVTIDNLCIKYVGSHAIHAYDATNLPKIETVKNMVVTNCEIGWVGGGIQSFSGTNGAAVRFGNGVELYGSCDNYRVENCYIYQCYDAGVTHQRSATGTENTFMNNVTYKGNLIENCVYGIEYFLNIGISGNEIREGENILFEDNIIRMSGFGLGSQRPNNTVCAAVKGLGSGKINNIFKNFIIKNNIFDRGTVNLVQTTTSSPDCYPVYDGNTFIQYDTGILGYNGITTHKPVKMNVFAQYGVINTFGDNNASIFFVKH